MLIDLCPMGVHFSLIFGHLGGSGALFFRSWEGLEGGSGAPFWRSRRGSEGDFLRIFKDVGYFPLISPFGRAILSIWGSISGSFWEGFSIILGSFLAPVFQY